MLGVHQFCDHSPEFLEQEQNKATPSLDCVSFITDSSRIEAGQQQTGVLLISWFTFY